jgi:hypothetical protein
VCADPDPWASPSQDWFGVWEETIPGTRGGQGRLLGDDDPDNVTGADRVEFRAEIDFCESGILGDDDVAGARADVECNALAAEREPAGDQVVILSPPLPRERLEGLRDDGALEISDDELTACDDLRAGIEEEPDSILAFPIERAYADRLVIGDGTLVRPVGDVSSWKVVQRCVGGAPLQFDIRSRDAFVVSSALTGFQHRVRENTAGRCVVDPERDPRRSGRAWLGCTFRNEAIAFRPRLGPGTVDPPAGTLLRAGAASPAGRVVMDLRPSAFGRSTVVPVQLFYNAVDGRLYVVDIHRRGLIPITLDPFPESSPGSFQ